MDIIDEYRNRWFAWVDEQTNSEEKEMDKIKEIKDDPRPCSFFWDEEDKTLSLRFYDKDNVYAIADYTLSKEDTADLYKFPRDNYAVSLRNNLGKDDLVSDNKDYK